MTHISWLHITDLHIGVRDDTWVWPGVKHDFYRDLEVLRQETDGWDLVFFTGDLTQAGTPDEFRRLTIELQEMWEVLSRGRTTPQLCVVPGNHDLRRPDPNRAVTKALTQLWWSDAELRNEFWRSGHSEQRLAIGESFENYANWLASAPVPILSGTPGILPGDFASTFEKDGVRLGILGLNSSFLQLVAGDFLGKLDTHVQQLLPACEADIVRWLGQRDGAVLLTHHPTSWLHPTALEHFRQEVYPPGRFLAHFCGHQHEASMLDTSEAGAPHRRLRQGASLLGLENWHDSLGQQQKRIHGYNAGQFIFEPSRVIEKVWPRTAIKGRHGAINLRPDHSYVLVNESVVTPIELDREKTDPTSSPAGPIGTTEAGGIALLEPTPDGVAARSRLATCPRLTTRAHERHRGIRQSEQSELELHLRRSRWAWLRSDWGMGTHEFIAATIDRFGTETQRDIYLLRAEDLVDAESIESVFAQQFGVSLQLFCSLADAGENVFLVVDDVPPSLATGRGLALLRRIVTAITEYGRSIAVIVVSRVAPIDPVPALVELRPLDVPDVRAYLMSYPGIPTSLHDAESVEAIHDKSDGLPFHLDRIAEALKVSSLTAVLASGNAPERETLGETSKALARTVIVLASSQDKRSRRTFRLLKVLAILSHGEAFETLKHYLPAEPFFEENALQLLELGLLDVVPLSNTSARGVAAATGVARRDDAPKLLRVPRPVRDHLQAVIGAPEAEEIVLVGIDLFFGRRWREGIIKVRKVPLEHREYLSSIIGNEFALLTRLLTSPATTANALLRERASRLCVEYVGRLADQARFRDLATVGGTLLPLINTDDVPKAWFDLTALYAKGLRMMGKHSSALEYYHTALEAVPDDTPHSDLASIWLNIAFCHEHDNPSEAQTAANEVLKYASEGSGTQIQARSLLADLGDPAKRNKKLTALEKQARSEDHIVAANNLCLILAKDAPLGDKLQHLNRVLASKGDDYNHVRAIVAKARAMQAEGRAGDLRGADLRLLAGAYAYLHSQRFQSLFDQCHDALWTVFERDASPDRLLLLFRHTSFLWRIRGQDEKEAVYLQRLRDRQGVPNDAGPAKGLLADARYFLQRLKSLISATTGIHIADSKPRVESR